MNPANGLIRQPLLFKFFLVFMLTGFLVLSAVVIYLAFFLPARSPFLYRHNLEHYTSSLANEIGNPPNYEHASQLAAELGIGVRIQTPAGSVWKSSEGVPEFAGHSISSSKDTRVGRDRRALFSEVNLDGTLYTFYLQSSPPARGLIRQLMWLAGFLILILLLGFLAIRWLFHPMQWLMAGVQAISEGQLDYQVTFRPGDEFAALASAFNQMTRKIADMLRARERLFLDLSHELRSPLTRLQLSTEFVEKPDLRVSLKQDLHEMESMIGEVLEGARLESPHGGLRKMPIDLAAMLRDLVGKHAATPPGVVLELQTGGQKLLLLGDERQLKSAFGNLIENACKYSTGSSHPVEVLVGVQADGGISVAVKDHGIGIPREEQNLVFEPFYRVDKSRTRETGGFGLGLNLALKIITAHGGKLNLTSEVGRGTIFRIWLPTRIGPSFT